MLDKIELKLYNVINLPRLKYTPTSPSYYIGLYRFFKPFNVSTAPDQTPT